MTQKVRNAIRIGALALLVLTALNARYRYTVNSPASCPATWEGWPVTARLMDDGLYECTEVVDRSDETLYRNIPIGERSGLPGVPTIVVIVGAVAFWFALESWVSAGR